MDTRIVFIDIATYAFASVVFFLLPTFALWDMFKKKGKSRAEYVLWVSIIIVVPMFGPVSYFFFGRTEGTKPPYQH